VRQALFNLLSITESNSFRGYSLNDVVLRPLSNGQIYEWIYFGETGAKFRLIQIARRHRATIYDCNPRLVDLYLGSISQLCLTEVVDIDGVFVPPKARLILSPDFVLSRVENKENLTNIIKEAPFVTLGSGKW
jgi:hypothetical protein